MKKESHKEEDRYLKLSEVNIFSFFIISWWNLLA